MESRAGARVWALRVARVALVVGVVAWLALATDLGALWAALTSIPGWVFAVIGVLAPVGIAIAGLRWQVVMRAYGAHPLPPLGILVRAFLVGSFYNTFVPGSVGGDVVRGVISRRNFESPAAGLFVVVTERLLGLSALAVVFVAGVAFGPRLVSQETAAWATAALAALGLGVLVAAKVSGLLGRLWAKLPQVHHIPDLVVAFGVSAAGHAVALTIHWVLAVGLELPISFTDLLLVVPLSLIAGVLPINIAGAGAREAAMVVILGQLGVASERALALSLGFWSVVVATALTGGLLQLLGKGLDLAAVDDAASAES